MSVKLRLAIALLVALVSFAAHAHPMPGSLLSLELEKRGVRAELRMPLQQLEVGLGRSISAPLTANKRRELVAYVAQHLSAIDPKGRPWRTDIGDVKIVSEQGTDEISVDVRLTPPAGASPRKFTLRCDVIVHQLLSHKIAVQVRRDWKVKIPADEPVFAGWFTYLVHELPIDPS